jgi:hypothetical protein
LNADLINEIAVVKLKAHHHKRLSFLSDLSVSNSAPQREIQYHAKRAKENHAKPAQENGFVPCAVEYFPELGVIMKSIVKEKISTVLAIVFIQSYSFSQRSPRSALCGLCVEGKTTERSEVFSFAC